MQNDKCQSDESEADQGTEPVYDLEERTAVFGENVIDYLKALPRDEITRPLISQLVRCATSVGANYSEADDGVSRRDFHHRIGTFRKEAKESKFFLRMLARAVPGKSNEARMLWKEARELHLILSRIYWKTMPDDRRKKKRKPK